MICALKFIISNHYEIKCLRNLLRLEPCNIMLKVISDIMAYWYDMWNTFVIAINFCNAKKMISALMFTMSNHYGIKCLSNLLQLEWCNVMFKVISDIMAHWYDMWNTIVIAINFCNAMKMICALMFIISNHNGIKCLRNRLQLEPCNVMFKVISVITAHWYDMWNTFVVAINFCNAKKINCALMFIISNHYGIKCLSNLLRLEPHIVMFKVISDIMAHWYHKRNSFVIAINFCNGKKMICALKFIISNHYRIKCPTHLLQFKPFNVMFKAKKMNSALMFIISNHYGMNFLVIYYS